jgi:TPR repeat
MTPRKRLDGELASWHPHPKESPASLVPVVRDAGAADDLADRFFDSAPALFTPEPPAIETTPKRTALELAKVHARRRYLMRYVAGAVGVAALIGLAAVVRVTTARDASAAGRFVQTQPMSAAIAAPAQPAEPSLPADPVVASAPPSDPTIAAVPAIGSTLAAVPAAGSAAEIATAAPAPETSVTEPAANEPPHAGETPAEAMNDPADTADAVDALPAETAPAQAAQTSKDDVRAAAEAKRRSQRALERGHLSAAVEAGQQSIALDPTDADAWLILGAAYQKQGHYAQARRCFSRCSKRARRGARGECRALLR